MQSLMPGLRPIAGASRWAPAILLVCCGHALAAEGAAAPSESLFVAQLVVLMLAGRLLGEAMQRIGQPAVMGQLLAGILLGPSVFGALAPDLQHMVFPPAREQKSMVDAISQVGILLLLMLTGMETDLRLVRKVGRAAVAVSLAGVALPFACGVALGALLPASLLPKPDQRLLTALFLGTALSISSIKIVAAIVRDMKFTRRDLGQVIVSSAIMEDTLGWTIIAITLSLAQAGRIDVASVAKSLIGTAVFLAASLTVGRRLVFLVIRTVNDHFVSEFAVITAILVVMGAMALATQLIGVNTVLGAFVSGILIGESPILTRHIDEQLRGLITAFFMPVFFGLAGLSADLTILASGQLFLLALGLIAIASIGKFSGAFVGGRIGGLSWREALALGCGMNARGSTEVIVATIGLSTGALSQTLFTIIVAMAITTTMAMPPMLRWALERVPLRKAEKERLEREEVEAHGFVPKLERLLLAVDHSPNGRFASRLAGLLAGQRGIPITVLPLTPAAASAQAPDAPPGGKTGTRDLKAERDVKSAAADSKKSQPSDEKAAPVDVTVRSPDAPTPEALAEEAQKGYDLLFIGIERTRAKSGGFHRDLDRLSSAFEGPMAVVDARGVHLDRPEQSPLDILVPVNGTEISRRAAELAVAVARVFRAPITAFYVTALQAHQRGRAGPRGRRYEEAILREIAEIAAQYDQEIATTVRAHAAPADAMVAEAERGGAGGHNIVIMGVDRRPGDKLFFGETAASVFERSPATVVFVAS